jgi:4-hydroxybenzoyl-CoA thioesterase/acyl-CoA thioester hydrolase
MYEHRTRRRVEFADTDMAGIAHFSRFFVFMESAEHEFLRAIGTSVHTRVGDDEIGWPRVRASLDFLRPVRFEDELDIRVRVLRKGRSSVTWGVDFWCGGMPVARGELVSACCRIRPGSPPEPIAIPDEIGRDIEEAPRAEAVDLPAREARARAASGREHGT